MDRLLPGAPFDHPHVAAGRHSGRAAHHQGFARAAQSEAHARACPASRCQLERAARQLLSAGPAWVGVLASLYAGYLNPEFRVTASQLSAVINGFATILLFALIDPQLSVMTDDVVEGRLDETLFRRTIVWISFSRLAGTLLAQLIFVPSAVAVAWVANHV